MLRTIKYLHYETWNIPDGWNRNLKKSMSLSRKELFLWTIHAKWNRCCFQQIQILLPPEFPVNSSLTECKPNTTRRDWEETQLILIFNPRLTNWLPIQLYHWWIPMNCYGISYAKLYRCVWYSLRRTNSTSSTWKTLKKLLEILMSLMWQPVQIRLRQWFVIWFSLGTIVQQRPKRT